MVYSTKCVAGKPTKGGRSTRDPTNVGREVVESDDQDGSEDVTSASDDVDDARQGCRVARKGKYDKSLSFFGVLHSLLHQSKYKACSGEKVQGWLNLLTLQAGKNRHAGKALGRQTKRRPNLGPSGEGGLCVSCCKLCKAGSLPSLPSCVVVLKRL